MKQQSESKKVAELLSDFDTAMLVTHGAAGTLHARPMMIAEHHGGTSARITFLTDVQSNKAAEIADDQRVALTFQSSKAYMSVTGRAWVEQDPKEVERLYGLMTSLWFDGPDDPRLGVIHVGIETVEYWDNGGRNLIRFAAEAARAIATDRRPTASVEQHGVFHP